MFRLKSFVLWLAVRLHGGCLPHGGAPNDRYWGFLLHDEFPLVLSVVFLRVFLQKERKEEVCDLFRGLPARCAARHPGRGQRALRLVAAAGLRPAGGAAEGGN